MSDNGDLLWQETDGVGIVTLNRPQARNALTFAMYEGIREVCERVTNGSGLRAIIITGSGDKAFAAGTDIAAFRDFSKPQDALDYEARVDKVLAALEAVPVPTIAAISGACTGGGAAIAATCDLRLGTHDMKFGFPIARTLGNCLSNNNIARLSAMLGAHRVKEIIFTSRLIEAEEALKLGLVSELHDSKDHVLAAALALAEKLKGHAPLTMRATKEALRRLRVGQGNDDHDLIVECYMSDDFREGMEAFLAKRKPDWKGK
ncbi:MAG: enoyl-CoA hydratase/isomerase family protein [Anderseniella sp.]